jgi:hypothetical protein
LQRQAEIQEFWEQRLSESNEQERAALEFIQQDHEIVAARDIAIATARARERGLANEFAQRSIDEDQKDDADHFVSLSIQEQNP